MDNFFTWDVLRTYVSFVSSVFTVVEFTKELPIIKKIPTKYWSFIVSFVLLLISNIVTKRFVSKKKPQKQITKVKQFFKNKKDAIKSRKIKKWEILN